MDEGGPSMRQFIGDFIAKELDNYLHKNPSIAEALKRRIEQSEKERKELAGIKKLANERAKKANLHNKKLRDCRIHLSDELPSKGKEEYFAKQNQSTIFITEGDSASGSITKARNVETQAVFSLRGKPLNCFGLTKKVVYENEEFNLLQHALNIEDGLDGLRYKNIVIATDADVDGMHITRFKGLGEISPDEFGRFIGDEIRLQAVILEHGDHIQNLLEYYMGKNTQERQEFIIENLKVEIETPIATPSPKGEL